MDPQPGKLFQHDAEDRLLVAGGRHDAVVKRPEEKTRGQIASLNDQATGMQKSLDEFMMGLELP